ncbi:DNA ligase 1-like [Mercenaria mercenaria]|uniref:DNA ligase 1-like n=1 Tax=Mercenaria mercenaria TaxID=6596 RepID=UPI00234F1EA5|nr:DNA ligase 1-like [Mercenaria mercenaria]
MVHFRLSRQMFFIVTAVCMCTWISITFLVIKNGTEDKRAEENMYTPFRQDTKDGDTGRTVQEQKYRSDLKWENNQNKDPSHRNIKQGEIPILAKDSLELKNMMLRNNSLKENNKQEKDQTEEEEEKEEEEEEIEESKEEEEEEEEEATAINNRHLQKNDTRRIIDEVKKGDKLILRSNISVKSNEKYNENKNKNFGANAGAGDKYLNISVSVEDNDILKWNRWQNKNNANLQKINDEDSKLQDALSVRKAKKNLVMNNDEILEEEVVEPAERDTVRGNKNMIEDSEEVETDRAAKYRNFNDVYNAHAYVLDDGEDDNVESEDGNGDDIENNEISIDKYDESNQKSNDFFHKNPQENIAIQGPTKIGLQPKNANKKSNGYNGLNKAFVQNDNGVDDIVQKIQKFPKVETITKSPAKNKLLNVRKGNEHINHGGQPFAIFNKFGQNNGKVVHKQSEDDGIDPANEEEIKNYDRANETDNVAKSNQMKQEKDIFPVKHLEINMLGKTLKPDGPKQRFVTGLKEKEREKLELRYGINDSLKQNDKQNMLNGKIHAKDTIRIQRINENDGEKRTNTSGIGKLTA